MISAMFVMYIGLVDLVDVGRWCSWVLPERYKTKLLISDFMVWRSSSHFKVGNPTGILFSIESRTGNLIGILFSIESRIGNSIGVLFLIESRIVRTRLISQINLTNLKDTNTWWSTLRFEQEIFLIIEEFTTGKNRWCWMEIRPGPAALRQLVISSIWESDGRSGALDIHSTENSQNIFEMNEKRVCPIRQVIKDCLFLAKNKHGCLELSPADHIFKLMSNFRARFISEASTSPRRNLARAGYFEKLATYRYRINIVKALWLWLWLTMTEKTRYMPPP